jgi:siroheme synthase (precorrin-2 oxidase/ferrochelatase)
VTPVLPVALKLEGRACLVVGAGEEAEARARSLEATGAKVTLRDTFEPRDLDGAWLAVLTHRDAELAERMARETERRHVFFCAVDQPEVGSFSHLAIARAGPVFAAIGTHGEAPALARRLRELVEALFARAGLAEFAEKLAALRRSTPPEHRRDVSNRAVEGVTLEGKLVLPEPSDPGSSGADVGTRR